MSLIKSISGVRGTIGGNPGQNLTPIDIVQSTAGYAKWALTQNSNAKTIIVGRDGRISGPMVSQLAIQTLIGMGLDVIDLGLSTTPTVEMAVKTQGALGGIIFTASHNPKEWNALKFLNQEGEFISAEDGAQILSYIDSGQISFANVNSLGKIYTYPDAIRDHINAILALPYINQKAIADRNFSVVVDCINSTGAISIPPLLDALGVSYTLIHAEMTGNFAHNPEPLPIHMTDIIHEVAARRADLGIVVDPDVDRLALVCEDGSLFGEEYTLVAVADYLLELKSGNTISNLSSSRALSDVTQKYGGQYFASAVGEVNVVKMMKEKNARIGGEGNGGVILPDLHYGRDALVGIALILSHLAKTGLSASALRATYPNYVMIKDKMDIDSISLDQIYDKLKEKFAKERINDIDGLKIDFEEGWVHLRPSNTEPIIRIYAESKSEEEALKLINLVKNQL